MQEHLHHFDEVGDDIVFEPYYRLGWDIVDTGWGVDVIQIPGPRAADGSSIGYTFNFPIKTPADAARLKPRQFSLDRQGTTGQAAPARGRLRRHPAHQGRQLRPLHDRRGCRELGRQLLHRSDLADLPLHRQRRPAGWVYESPETIHALMEYMAADRERQFGFLEQEGLDRAQHRQPAGGPTGLRLRLGPALPGRGTGQAQRPVVLGRVTGVGAHQPGHVRGVRAALPQARDRSLRPRLLRLLRAAPRPTRADHGGHAQPALGLCHALGRLRQRWPRCWATATSSAASPIRCPSAAPRRTGTARRPTCASTRRGRRARCNVELLFRDVYDIGGDRSRLATWVKLARSVFEA